MIETSRERTHDNKKLTNKYISQIFRDASRNDGDATRSGRATRRTFAGRGDGKQRGEGINPGFEESAKPDFKEQRRRVPSLPGTFQGKCVRTDVTASSAVCDG
jgi:hypothetical protein